MINFLKKFRYQTIGIKYSQVQWIDRDNQIEKIAYILKENGFGKRKIIIHQYGYCKIYEMAKLQPVYTDIILPWLNYCPNYEIQKYLDILGEQKEKTKKEKKLQPIKGEDNIIHLK